MPAYQSTALGSEITFELDAAGNPVVKHRAPRPVALASPPAQTSAGSATALAFAEPITHLVVQNNGAAALGIEWDGSTATAGSLQLAAGASLFLDCEADGLSLLTAAATNINGAAAANIVVKGAA